MDNKWVFDELNCRVVSEDDSINLFYTNELTCSNETIQYIVNFLNTLNYNHLIDNADLILTYLLYVDCTTEDMEFISNTIYKTLFN